MQLDGLTTPPRDTPSDSSEGVFACLGAGSVRRMTRIGNIELQNGLDALLRPVDGLEHYPSNPRRGDVDAIRASLEAHGLYRPLVVQKSTGYILAGNHLFDALMSGATPASEVPCVVVDVDDDHAKKIVLADNRTSDLGRYDNEVLAVLLREVGEQGSSRAEGLAGTGYSSHDLDRLIASLPVEAPADLDDAPPLPEGEKVSTSKPGDVWLLGEHRLMCGDSTSVEDVDVLTQSGLVDAVFTDPPYGVSYVGGTKDALSIKNDDAAGLTPLLTAAFSVLASRLKPGGVFYVCAPAGDKETEFRNCLDSAGLRLRQQIVWAKNALVLGHSDYQWKHETVFYGWADGEAPEGPLPLYDEEHETVLYGWADGASREWHGGRKQTTIWNYAKPAASRLHPTMKPVALVRRALLNSTSTGDVVLDLFGGSGTTLIACEKEGRVARLMELDPRYVDVICSRWEQITGQRAVLEATGEAFEPAAS